MQNPNVPHINAVLRILRYLKKNPEIRLLYKGEKSRILDIYGFVDAEWAGSTFDRRSTSGYCISLRGNLVIWKSKKQNMVARSSAKS